MESSTLIITSQIRIPLSELELTYVRSSGPGGQNVNKVNSKAVLRWNLAESDALSDEVRHRVMNKLGDRLTREGEIIVTSDSYRDQLRNREDCLEKLKQLIAAAAARPKIRKKTKPSRSSQRKNQARKRQHSEKKKLRGGRSFHED